MSLSKRTHIMLDPRTFDWLKQKSQREQKTIGSLVRLLLEKEYQQEVDQVQRDRQGWWESVQQLRTKHSFKGTIDYKALINDGRKY